MEKRKTEPTRYCQHCRARLHRKVYNGRLEDNKIFRSRKYCDRLCMAEAMVKDEKDISRAGAHWRARQQCKDACERCGGVEKLHVHHKDRNWRNGALDNLETLCETCHGKEHGEERGDRFATRQWIEKELMADIWIACREALAILESDPTTQGSDAANRLRDVMHRGGQL